MKDIGKGIACLGFSEVICTMAITHTDPFTMLVSSIALAMASVGIFKSNNDSIL